MTQCLILQLGGDAHLRVQPPTGKDQLLDQKSDTSESIVGYPAPWLLYTITQALAAQNKRQHWRIKHTANKASRLMKSAVGVIGNMSAAHAGL